MALFKVVQHAQWCMFLPRLRQLKGHERSYNSCKM